MLSPAQLTGRETSHLLDVGGGQRLLPEVASAFTALRQQAAGAGFDLAIASAHRDYQRQLAIFNDKALGRRPVHDDRGVALAMDDWSPAQRLRAILRFSALPGTSRHHWGTDIDVYDAAAMPAGYRLELSPQEVAPGGMFDALHRWLDEQMAAGQCCGFYRPYTADRGGVAPERWHLSYAPLAASCEARLSADILRRCWDAGEPLQLRDEAERALEELLERYVAVPPDWCPARYRE